MELIFRKDRDSEKEGSADCDPIISVIHKSEELYRRGAWADAGGIWQTDLHADRP
jgi:hypothetical protein